MDKNKEKILRESIYNTYDVFRNRPNVNETQAQYQAYGALSSYIRTGELNYFTQKDEARKNIGKNFTREELANFIADNLIQVASNNVARNNFEKKVFFEIVRQQMFSEIPFQTIKKQIMQGLMGKTNSILGYDAEMVSEMAASLYTSPVIKQIVKEKEEMEHFTQNRIDSQYKVKNLRFNRNLINQCREEVLNGTQIKIQNDIKAQNLTPRPRREYNLNDEMVAVTDIGRKRSNQQDSILMLYHPTNPNYKMLVVADGMGGSVEGQKASMEIVKQMVSWFESLDQKCMLEGNKEYLKRLWENKLDAINQKIVNAYSGSGSTFVGAIVGEKSTIITSVGDSRGYILGNDNELYQLTDDDSMPYKMWKYQWDNYEKDLGRGMNRSEIEAKKRQKDNIRFHRESNMITRALGIRDEKLQVDFSEIANKSYKSLMLFSDGVTDCLSDDQIMAITRQTKPKDLAKAIVDVALVTDSNKPELAQHAKYGTRISGGKDNTSAVIYNKRDGEER